MSYDNNPIGRQSHARTLVGLINGYLQRSINSNTIAVSANLVSRDGCLIAAVRDGSSIDSNTGYCSANGQTEFRDNFVTFYRNSVYSQQTGSTMGSRFSGSGIGSEMMRQEA